MKITRKASSALIVTLLVISVFAGCDKDIKADESSLLTTAKTIVSESGTTEPASTATEIAITNELTTKAPTTIAPTAKATTTKANVVEKITFEKAFDHLVKSVPEVDDFLKSDGTVCRFDKEPDPLAADYYDREYFQFYLGYDHEDRTERWNSFYVKKDLSDISVLCMPSGEICSLDEWRLNNTF